MIIIPHTKYITQVRSTPRRRQIFRVRLRLDVGVHDDGQRACVLRVVVLYHDVYTIPTIPMYYVIYRYRY